MKKNKELIMLTCLFLITAILTVFGAFNIFEKDHLYNALAVFIVAITLGALSAFILLYKAPKITEIRLTAVVLIVIVTSIAGGIFIKLDKPDKQFEIIEPLEIAITTEIEAIETIETPENTELEAHVEQIWWREVPSEIYSIFPYSEVEKFLTEAGDRLLKIDETIEIIDVASFELMRESEEDIEYGPHAALLKIEVNAYKNEKPESLTYVIKMEDKGNTYGLKIEY